MCGVGDVGWLVEGWGLRGEEGGGVLIASLNSSYNEVSGA